MSNFENQVFSLLENTWKRHLSVSSWTTNLQGSRSASYQQMSLGMRSKYTLINSYVTLNRTLSQGAFAAAIKIILKNAANAPTCWVNTIWLPFRKLVTFKRPYLIFYFHTTFMNVLRQVWNQECMDHHHKPFGCCFPSSASSRTSFLFCSSSIPTSMVWWSSNISSVTFTSFHMTCHWRLISKNGVKIFYIRDNKTS